MTFIINDIKPLHNAKNNDLTFFESIKYKDQAINTNAFACITTAKLEKLLPKKIDKIIVKNVLLELAKILKKIYPDADVDHPDSSLSSPLKKKYKTDRLIEYFF